MRFFCTKYAVVSLLIVDLLGLPSFKGCISSALSIQSSVSPVVDLSDALQSSKKCIYSALNIQLLALLLAYWTECPFFFLHRLYSFLLDYGAKITYGIRLLLQRLSVYRSPRPILKELGFSGISSGHSFRRGAATSTREAGLSDAEFQLLGSLEIIRQVEVNCFIT